MKKTLTVLSIALLATSMGAAAKDWKQVRFGVDPTYQPFEYKAADGKVVGFDIDLGNEICRRMNAKCVWVESSFDGMIPALKARKFDGVLSSMSKTEKRMKEIDFSAKLFHGPTNLVAKVGSGLQPTAASLKGKRVGVEQGSTQEAFAKTYWEPKGVNVVAYQNQDQVYQDLVSGRLDATLQDTVTAKNGFLKTPAGRGYNLAGAGLDDEKTLGYGTAVGLRKEDTDLKAAINGAIAAMLKDGTYQKIAAKYFDFDVYGH
ncbi:ABC transporter substrate-binding protein [Crenobacter sp. SG2303]|uniref:ABC transporter substrate-binding protein n=1 Tax=Crenobacter oryzisoli TaxID=3056844 RepID=A0ABT7XRK4_9NEIS|nr:MULTISPECIES: ABC transporter substrate-binding protein [unclassified Crenobacter]MDN0076421.1 ABC transporter substrate-binding protein [Crenobacter sp. SG2303]MDN0085648.1 ABC transporter substrate-binding protein [Crenobacter sp. SG2305]